ncbi:MAG: DtxR family transcriptional regulator [Proteobacteria bacterium]|nr:MAG: DtxR family transcriptional regulator [Pseudomonadota bacterium]
MLKTLSDRGLVHYEKYEYIELTKSGKRIGKDMRHKHEVLDQFLTEVLKIDAETANEEACKMEHALSTETLDSLVDFMEFIQACPRAGNNWLDHFDEFRKQGAGPEKCLMRADDFSCSYRKEAAAPKDVDSKKTGHIKQ